MHIIWGASICPPTLTIHKGGHQQYEPVSLRPLGSLHLGLMEVAATALVVASTHTQSRSASTNSVKSHQCWLGLVLCQIRCCDEPFVKKSFTLRLSGCTVAAVGVEGMVIIDDLLAIGILIHL